jgi:cytochrome c oxidase assembly protein subunit 11
MSGIVITVIGLSYASVPLYKAFCQMTGFGGTTQRYDELKSTTVKPVEGGRILRVNFQANVHSAMPWSFKPTQRDVRIVPGETALAFYTVHNPTDKAITGVATYNVHPPKAGLYFNKVQCFCFEEQRIGPGEEIDMPVFFFIDPEFLADPAMENVNLITLSYTFFKTGEDEEDLAVPMPKPVSVAAVSVAAVSVKSSSS